MGKKRDRRIEPEYDEEEEETEEQGKDYIWIKGGVIEKERERQATIYGKGSRIEGGFELLMEIGEITSEKRRQTIIDNEEANFAHKQEMHRQGHRNYAYNNTEQSGNERHICHRRKIQRGTRFTCTYR
jgi:hypothetical protein